MSGRHFLPGDALGVDPEQHGHAAARPLGDLGGRDTTVSARRAPARRSWSPCTGGRSGGLLGGSLSCGIPSTTFVKWGGRGLNTDQPGSLRHPRSLRPSAVYNCRGCLRRAGPQSRKPCCCSLPAEMTAARRRPWADRPRHRRRRRRLGTRRGSASRSPANQGGTSGRTSEHLSHDVTASLRWPQCRQVA